MPESARQKDINGWVEIKGNPLSKVGVFPYLGKTIDPKGESLEPEKIYNVLRPEEELNNDECIDSFKLLPWINEHEMLGGELTPAEKKGIEGVIGEDVYFDSDDKTLKANIKIFSESLKESIDAGKEELSCGYRCKYVQKSGNFSGERYDFIQRMIRGNHLALVDQGRMGPDVAVLDESHRMNFTLDIKDLTMDPEDKSEDENTEDMSPADIAAALKALSDAVAELQKDKPEDEEGKDEEPKEDAEDEGEEGEGMDSLLAENKKLKAEIGEIKSTVDSLEKNGMKSLLGQISKRDILAGQVSNFVGVFDHSEMTLSDVAKYGVEKLKLTCDAGEEVATLRGYLHDRKPCSIAHAMDGAKKTTNKIDSYLKGVK